MAHDEDEPSAPPEEAAAPEGLIGRPRRRNLRRAFMALCVLALLTLAGVWLTRERIANSVIAGQLAGLDLPATYEIESIGPGEQVLRNVVVGDPRRPDLTIERVRVGVVAGWSGPGIGRITLIKPRLFGSYRGGQVSFGSLDKVLFTGSKEPFRLPDLDLSVQDGRALVESDYGPAGIKLEGAGRLRDGFRGMVAVAAPNLADPQSGCAASAASLYGAIRVAGEKPRFEGPLRLGALTCSASQVELADTALQVAATFDRGLDGAEGRLGLKAGRFAAGDNRLAASEGDVRFTWRKRALTARYELSGQGLATPHVAAATVQLEGALRGADGFARIESEGTVNSQGVATGRDFDAALAGAQTSAAATFAAPLLAQFRAALADHGAHGRLTGRYIVRRAGQAITVVVPQAALLGRDQQTLLSVSRFQLIGENGAPARLAGNFAMAGDAMPHVEGRVERHGADDLVMRMTMAEYRAADASLALPRLTVIQQRGGAIGFAGEARLSGALPGGRADNLVVPLHGDWSQRAGLTMWRQCAAVRFDRLALANLTLDRRNLSFCPPRGGAIVRADAHGARIAAGTPAIDLSGRLGTTPIRIRSQALGFAVPGMLAARGLDVALGPASTASHFKISSLDAQIGKDIAGRFDRSDIRLAAVPLDMLEASGAWRFANGRLSLSDGRFRLEDREIDDRFQPLIARDATLSLVDNRIVADAVLREPTSDRAAARVAVRHSLNDGAGRADIAVDDLAFDQQLQPDMLTRLALGVVANAKGRVRGTGRIDWNAREVTSSGQFTTDSFDFAAAFGPVAGVSGTIVFTDLLGLRTAPDQKLRLASVNPGIEVTDGELTYELLPDRRLAVHGARWPFMDGELTLRPVTMQLGATETRQYALDMKGVSAARFVERMELANLSATGVFDGELPMIFDQNGGRIEGGMLRSRPPGGNVSYVGALTYENLSPMANFAFDVLKSLNYSEMTIGMDGAIEGEIVTRVRFRGVTQGAGAKRNFLVDRIAKLPIQFNVNLRAPFLQLVTSFKSFYDPAYVRDPRSLGLIDEKGQTVPRPGPAVPQPVPSLPVPSSTPQSPPAAKPRDADIQP